MTKTVSRTAGGNPPSPAPPKLAELLEDGTLDWDSPHHREAYLRAFTAGAFSPHPPEVPRVAVTRRG